LHHPASFVVQNYLIKINLVFQYKAQPDKISFLAYLILDKTSYLR